MNLIKFNLIHQILLYVSFIQIIHSKNSRIFSINGFNYIGKINIECIFGKSEHITFLDVQLETPFTWISQKHFKEDSSYIKSLIPISNNTITINGNLHNGSLFADTLTLLSYPSDRVPSKENRIDITFNNYYFYYFRNVFTGLDSISLAYKFNNNNFSIVHQLFYNNIIDNNQFSISRQGTFTSYVFTFGGIPKEISNNKYKYKCNVLTYIKDSSWNCKLNSIYFFNNNNNKILYQHTNDLTTVSFQTNEDIIYSSENFFTFVIEHILKDQFMKGDCKHENYTVFQRVTCICNSLNTIPNLYIVIDNVHYILDYKMLFSNLLGVCVLLIKPRKEHEHVLRIGSTFFNMYSTLFDYDLNTITIYTEKQLLATEVINTNLNLIKFIMNIISFFLIIGSFLLSTILYMN